MWEYFQQSQNACSVSSALHQLAGTLLIRRGTEGIRVGGRGGWKREEVREKMSVYLHSIIYLLSSDSWIIRLSTTPYIVYFSLWLCLVTSGSFSPGKHKSSHPEIEPTYFFFLTLWSLIVQSIFVSRRRSSWRQTPDELELKPVL